ncbi:MAG: archaemetzincin [Chryseolinea sp.]
MPLRILPFVFVVLFIVGCRKSDDKIVNHRRSARDTELINRLASLDQKLLPPRRGEWLSVHKEPGQTYGQYVASEPVRATETRNIIYILPIGSFTPCQDSVIQYTAEYLKIFFKLPVEVMEAQENDNIVAEGARVGDEGRQLFTTSILDYLKRIMPDDAIVIMALTATDLYAESYNFVFGRGSMRERVGVSSMARFSKERLLRAIMSTVWSG